MPKGLPASYIKQARRLMPKAGISGVFKKAWSLYKGSKVYKPLTKKVTGGKKMAKAKKRGRRRRSGFTLPIAAVGGAAAGFVINAPWGGSPVSKAMTGDWKGAFDAIIMNYTGINTNTGAWDPVQAKGAWAAIAGILMHMVASRLGVNRALGRAGVPILRI